MAAASWNRTTTNNHHHPDTNVRHSSPSQAWQNAIARATECLRNQNSPSYNHPGHPRNRNNHLDTEQYAEIVRKSLSYLVELEWILNKKNKNRPPRQYPPPFSDDPNNDNDNSNSNHSNNNGSNTLTRNPSKTPTNNNNYSFSSNNPFAVIQYDDEEDDDNEAEEKTNDDEVDEEAGDRPMMSMEMATRRLLLYILTGQADLLACQARGYRSHNQWRNGAECCQTAVQKVQSALVLADSEISRHLQKWEEQLQANNNSHRNGNDDEVMRSRQLENLMADGQAVHIAVLGLVRERNQFLRQAESQEQRLLRVLQPQWKSRDHIKQRMGQRWYNNPAPKHDYAKSRQEAEAQLREIQWALEHVRPLDTEGLQSTSQELLTRLQQQQYLNNNSNQQSQQQQARRSTRYNGLRPLDLSGRVSLEEYPDPVEFGWKFTGSNEISKVEFFEKEFEEGIIVKLDWYYTTGTVKTSMEHPQQGKTQLFASGKRITPEKFIQILLNPREHTGIRYHQRRR
jgi:hypothetical protein